MNPSERILVTGGSGFIGGALAETLVSQGIAVRVTTSNPRHCERINNLPIEIIEADLNDHVALANAVAGCSVVFHVAYRFGSANQQRANLDGTRALAEAFHKSGGRRFVHVSSMCAYGDPCDGELTEETPPNRTSDAYSEIKLEIDRFLLKMHRTQGLPVTIVQPTIVYGPYGTFWTAEPLRQVRSTRIGLPGGGLGLCNAVYVDDVVSALMLAARSDAGVGQAFLISGSEPVTWREFYGAFERMLERQSVVELDDEQWRAEQHRRSSLIRRMPQAIARRLSGELPLFLPEGPQRTLLASKTRVRIGKARKILGYNPTFDLESGMKRTAEWARQTNLLASQPGAR